MAGVQAPGEEPGKRTGWPLGWLGLPHYPGIPVFFLSAALSHHLFEILKYSDFEDLAAESLEAVLIGALLSALTVALIRYRADAAHLVLSRLSLTLFPGILFLFAPFRYSQVCRWTGWCQYWSDSFLVCGGALCALVGLYTWRGELRWRLDSFAASTAVALGRMSPMWLFASVWTLCLLLLVWRGWDRLVHPELFAEGGRQFVSDALHYGWASLANLYAGYLHTAPRLLALLGTSLAPVAHIPTFTVAACFAVAAAASAFISRHSFRWLIPSDGLRIAAALLLCLVPGLREVLGNLPNLHYLLFVVLGLLMLKDPDDPYRAWELALSLLIVLSSGMVAALAPGALARLWIVLIHDAPRSYPRRLCRNFREVAFAAIIVLPTLVMGLLVLGGVVGTDTQDAAPEPWALLRAWGTAATSMFLLHPIAGTVAVTEIVSTIPQTILVPIALAALVLSWRVLAATEDAARSAAVTVWLSAPFVLVTLVALTRSPDLKMFLLDEDWSWYKWWMRYNYLFAVYGVLAWLFLLRPTSLVPKGRVGNVLALTLCVAYASQANWYFQVAEYGKKHRWKQTSAELERAIRTGCPRTVRVEIYPGSWWFTYRSDKVGRECTDGEQ